MLDLHGPNIGFVVIPFISRTYTILHQMIPEIAAIQSATRRESFSNYPSFSERFFRWSNNFRLRCSNTGQWQKMSRCVPHFFIVAIHTHVVIGKSYYLSLSTQSSSKGASTCKHWKKNASSLLRNIFVNTIAFLVGNCSYIRQIIRRCYEFVHCFFCFFASTNR